MSDAETRARPAADREACLRNLRRANERQEDALAADFDARYGEIERTHQMFVERFLSRLPPDGRVLDAACGTGKYFPMVLASGLRLLGVDHAGAYLARAAAKFPGFPPTSTTCRSSPIRASSTASCAWMPWSSSHRRIGRWFWSASIGALRPGGWLYLTVDLAHEEQVREANQAARRSGLPVMDGEVIWEEPDGYYHHHPRMQHVRAWLAAAGFAIAEEAEGPWNQEGLCLSPHAGPPGGPAGLRMSVLWHLDRRLSRRREQRVTEDNLALDVRGSPGKTGVCMALSPRLLIRMRSPGSSPVRRVLRPLHPLYPPNTLRVLFIMSLRKH
jgi:SAM-dependent methyltransferase